MSYTVLVSLRAAKDVDRLDLSLTALNPRAGAHLGDLLEQAIANLADYPLRGRPASATTREINIPFGQGAYIIRYRVSGDRVTVTRIWHSLEQRR